jgi:hypothetical protein
VIFFHAELEPTSYNRMVICEQNPNLVGQLSLSPIGTG